MQKQFDYIIYGATLEGILTGYYLHQKGFKTVVLESSDKAGSFFASIENSKACIHSLFTSPSYDDHTVRIADWFKNNFAFDNLSILKKTLPPITFEKGHFEPFVGFGENAPKEVEFLQDFTFADRLEFSPLVNDWIKAILTSGLELRYNSNLTAINVVEGKISDITINDKDTLVPKNFIFAENPANLIEFFESDSSGAKFVNAKALARLSKGTFWSTLQLSVSHQARVTDKEEIHVIYGTQKNPVVSVGKFHGNTSQWISFISADVPDINEEGVQILKEMKRQIKRAYPESLGLVEFEKIALWPQTHGYIELKAKRFGQLEGIENISLCSNHLIEHTNPFVGSLTAVQYMVEMLGNLSADHPESTPQKTAGDNPANA